MKLISIAKKTILKIWHEFIANKTVIIIAGMLILFENGLFSIFKDSIFGRAFFSHNNNIVVDIIYLLFGILLITYFYQKGKKNYRFTNLYWIFLGILIMYYVSFRIFPFWRPDLRFEFINSHIPYFKYSDALFLCLIFGITIFLWQKCRIRKKVVTENENENESKHFLLDSPIKEVSEDHYSYGGLAEQVCSILSNIDNTDGSFTIGINGKWGIGKTSFLNLLEKELEKELQKMEKDFILMKFSPLLLSTTNTLTTEFLLQLNRELIKYHSQANTHFRQYIFYLTNKIHDLWGLIWSVFYGDQSSKHQTKKIQDIVNQVDKLFIVFIDDLDRVEKNEILEMFKVIRNICDFSNMIFVFAIDKEYICQKLDDDIENWRYGERYIEKFFNVEVSLPDIDSTRLRKDLSVETNQHLKYLSKEIDEACNFSFDPQQKTSQEDRSTLPLHLFDICISTKRDLIRLINALMILPESHLGKINYIELFIVELIKLKYFKIFQALLKKSLIENRREFVYKVDKTALQEYMKHYPPYHNEHIKSAISFLFDNNLEAFEKKSIRNKDRFDHCFNFFLETSVNINPEEKDNQ